MKVAITGGTGFVGRHLARRLSEAGHDVVLVARGLDRRDESVRQLAHARFVTADISDEESLVAAFAGCDRVAHCAGINRELGRQTYRRVHVEGTRNVVNAAKRVRVRKVILLSFLRARPGCGSPYHESKWAAEEIVRSSGLDYTVIKAGLIYGRGDHMLDHLSHALHSFPAFPLVGMKDRPVRPTAIEDITLILQACLMEGRLSRQTVAVTGPEELPFGDAVRRVAAVLGRRVYLFRIPVIFHYLAAWCLEKVMAIPLVSLAQVRMLAEGIAEAYPACEKLPADLLPGKPFTDQQIREGLPEAGPFGLKDLRWFA